MLLDRDIPVLVLRRSLGPLQHGPLAVARSLGRLGVPVFSVRSSESEPSTASRYVRGALRLPTTGSDEDWVGSLSGLDMYFDGAILLPVDDAAAITVGDHRARLAERFRVPAMTDGAHRRLISKAQMNETCRELGLATPRSMSADSMTGALAAASQLGYPVVLKRDDAVAASSGVSSGRSVAVAPDEQSLRTLWPQMSLDGTAAPLLVQEYLAARFATVWMFNGYFDSASHCLGAFTGVKLRQSPSGAGPATLGVCRPNSELTAIATGLLGELGYSGIVDMDFCYDARDRRYKLLDVNPRLGGTFRLFASGSLDVVRALHLDLSGRPVPSAPCLDGRKWLDEAADLSACNELLRAHRFSFPSWRRSPSGVQETAWWAQDDPRPFLAMASDLAVRVGRRIRRRGSALRRRPGPPVGRVSGPPEGEGVSAW